MAIHVLKDVTHWVDEFDLSGDFRSAALQIRRGALDKTVWGDTTRVFKGGLWEIAFSGDGFYQADSGASPVLVANVLSTKLAVENSVVTVTPEGAADNARAWSFEALETEYSPIQGAVGDMGVFATASVGSGGWFRGTIMIPKASYTTTGNGTARQLGATPAGKKLYAALHVFAVSGTNPTLDVVVDSDDASDMASATTQITFAQKDAVGSEFASKAGVIADDWIRVDYTIGGTDTPTFNFAVAVGIEQ